MRNLNTLSTLSTVAIGLAIRLTREKQKITANDLAAQTGMNNSSLSRTERGLRMLQLDEAEKIALSLGMTIQDLIDVARNLEKAGVVRQTEEAAQTLVSALRDARAMTQAAFDAVDPSVSVAKEPNA